MIHKRVVEVLESRAFFWVIVGVFIIQALWVAFSYRYPMAFDEQYHYSIIQVFSHHWLPFITHEQPHDYYLRDLVHETSFLFHYLMSFPYRVMQLFTQSLAANVIILRVFNIAFVAVGLIGFAKLFRKIGIAERYVNIGLLAVVMMPLFTLVAATINYDNMLFMVVPFYFIACLDAMREKKLSWRSVVCVGALGMFASLIKYTFLPLFAATLIFVLIYVIRRDKSDTLKNIVTSMRKADKKALTMWLVPFVLLLAMFSGIYIKNVIVYHTPSPSCTQSMALQKCLASGIVARNVEANKTANERPVLPLESYTMNWVTTMRKGMAMTMNSTSQPGVTAMNSSPSIYSKALALGIATALFSIILISGEIYKKREWMFLLYTAAVVIVAIYLFNVHGYYLVHEAFANQPRYLIDAMPILAVIGVYAFARIAIGKAIKYAALIIGIIACTQGGGIITHIVESDSTWYWDNPTLIHVDDGIKKIVGSFVHGSTSPNSLDSTTQAEED